MTLFSHRPQKAAARPKGLGRVLVEYAATLGLAVLLALAVRSTAVMAYEIPSGSMLETLQVGDRVMVNKAAYDLKIPFVETAVCRWAKPQRGDIVVFEPPYPSRDPLIKRIIGLPGDKVAVVDKRVYVNDQVLDVPAANFCDQRVLPGWLQPRDNFGPVTVPAGKLFVMGDNRDQSYDSRFWGFADISQIKGKALFILWSWDAQHWRVRWGRLLSLVR